MIYVPPTLTECMPPDTWAKPLYQAPYPRGGRRKGRARKVMRFALELLGLASVFVVAFAVATVAEGLIHYAYW